MPSDLMTWASSTEIEEKTAMKVRDLKALLETMPGEADVVWQNDDSTEDVIRCESGMYSIVDSVEKITSSRLTQVFWGPVVVLGKQRKK